MQTNTNAVWYIIVGAIIILGIFALFRPEVDNLINKTFSTADGTIDITDFKKNEIKYDCLIFNNIKINTENNIVITADVENICYNDKTYNLNFEVYSSKEKLEFIQESMLSINASQKIEDVELINHLKGDILNIYDIQIKKVN